MSNLKTLFLQDTIGEGVSKHDPSLRKVSPFSWLKNDSFEHELEEDKIDDEILESALEAQHEDLKPTTCRHKLVQVLESNPVQIAIVLFVIIDAVLMVALLLLDLRIIEGRHTKLDKRVDEMLILLSEQYHDFQHLKTLADLEKMLNNPHKANNTHSIENKTVHAVDKRSLFGINSENLHRVRRNVTFEDSTDRPSSVGLARYSTEHVTHGSSTDQETTSGPFAKTTAGQHSGGGNHGGDHHDDDHDIVHASHAIHISSIVILALFLFEVILKVFGMGKEFFKKKMDVLDAIVIIASFTMDVVFLDGISGMNSGDAASLLIFFLMWRLLRVANALMVTAKKRLKFRISLQMSARKRAEKKVEALGGNIDMMEKEILDLKKLARKHGAVKTEIAQCKPAAICRKTSTAAHGVAGMLTVSMGIMKGFARSNEACNKLPAKIAVEIIEEDETETNANEVTSSKSAVNCGTIHSSNPEQISSHKKVPIRQLSIDNSGSCDSLDKNKMAPTPNGIIHAVDNDIAAASDKLLRSNSDQNL